MVQGLGVQIDDERWRLPRLPDPPAPLAFGAGPWSVGTARPRGFAFDNELGRFDQALPALAIDAEVLRWAEYLPFVQDGGTLPPRYLRREGRRWRHGGWGGARPRRVGLPPRAARGPGLEPPRRPGSLPTEDGWECAAILRPGDFR